MMYIAADEEASARPLGDDASFAPGGCFSPRRGARAILSPRENARSIGADRAASARQADADDTPAIFKAYRDTDEAK